MKRRKFLINRRLQFNYTALLVIEVILISGCIGGLLWHTNCVYVDLLLRETSFDDSIWQTVHQVQKLLVIRLGIALLAAFLLLPFVGIIATHRFAGPAHRIARYMREIKNGNYQMRFKPRRADTVDDLAKQFDEMLVSLQENSRLDMSDLEKMSGRVEELEKMLKQEKPSEQKISGSIGEIKEIIKKLQTRKAKNLGDEE